MRSHTRPFDRHAEIGAVTTALVLVLASASPAGFVGVEAEIVDLGAPEGAVTYRVYATFTDFADVLVSVSGNPSRPLAFETDTVLLNDPDGQWAGLMRDDFPWTPSQTAAWDSWVTIGDTGPFAVDYTEGFAGSDGVNAVIVGSAWSEDDGSWFDDDPQESAYPDARGRVLIAQFTLAEAGGFTLEGNVVWQPVKDVIQERPFSFTTAPSSGGVRNGAQCIHAFANTRAGGVQTVSAVATGDFDRDGDRDVVAANSSIYFGVAPISVLLNDGAGRFSPPILPDFGETATDIAVGDLDGNGTLDLAVTEADGPDDGVWFLPGLGDGGFGPGVYHPTGDGPRAVVVADLDGDLDPDIAVANGGSSDVSVFINSGGGVLAPEVRYAGGGSSIFASMAAGDVDGDGDCDLVVANVPGDEVLVHLNDGDGTFAPASSFSAGNAPRSATLADVSGDGVLDVVVANWLGSEVSVLAGTGDGAFAPPAAHPAGASVIAVAAADLDGDGDVDLATISDGDEDAAVLLNGGDGSFAPPAPVRAGRGHAVMTLADVSADGAPDLVVGAGGSTLGVLMNDGAGGFPADAVYATGASPAVVVVADVDGDGVPDLATPNAGDDDVSVLFGIGDGTFAADERYAVGAGRPVDMASGDLDGDGDADLATANFDSDTVSVLLNAGGGVFVLGAQPPVGDQPQAIVMADFDGDTDIDIATVNRADDDATILLNNGDGTFAPGASEPANDFPFDIHAGDVDGDGDVDLAVLGLAIGYSILRNDGDGSFTRDHVTNAAGNSPNCGAMGDLDGDGDPDLVAANAYGGDISIFMNRGDGTFSLDVRRAAGETPAAVALGDVNGDRLVDIAVSNFDDDDVGIYYGTGGGGFALRAARYGVDREPRDVTLADLDNDGDTDLVTANLGMASVSVLLNRCGCAGDLDGDGLIGFAELLDVLSHWGPCPPACPADLDADGEVGFGDVLLVLSRWGPCAE